jgi:hypothetical protein
MTTPTQTALSPSLRPPHGLSLPGPVWGLDPSTLRLSAAVVRPGEFVPLSASAESDPRCGAPGVGVFWATCSYSQAGSMERRLAAGLGELLRFLADLRNRRGAPAGIYLEEPFGGSDKPGPGGRIIKPHPHAFYFVGLVRCALGHLFAQPEVQMISPSTWKARALGTGHGFAKKPEIMQWAHEIGYTGNSEDEADALGIATAGAVILSA